MNSLLNKSWQTSPDTNSQAFNWSKNNFGEIHISQGLDWAFLSLPHRSLSVITIRTSNPVRLPSLWRCTSYLREKDENSIVKQSLKISVDLYHSGQNSFYSSLKKMTDDYDFPGFNCNLLNKCKIKQYVDLMQKKYITYWNHTLQHSQKLNFYYKIKTNYSPSVYLDLTRKNPSRKTLVKLRISSHKLRIETGRYDNIPRDERLCNLCNCNRIEDETHFLLDCPSFSSIREMFFSKLEPKIPFPRLQSHETLLSHLMNSTDYFINIQLISFISSCFEL